MTVYDYREITLKDDLCLEISRDTDIENPRENDCNPKADSQLEKDMSLLVGANRRKLSWLDIAVPTFSQSINVQRYGAELIKKLVKERLGIELYYRSELD